MVRLNFWKSYHLKFQEKSGGAVLDFRVDLDGQSVELPKDCDLGTSA